MLETTPVQRHQAGNYLQKATENAHAMKQALTDGNWNAACLLAVHCVISSADALTVSHLGLRSKSQRHQDAVVLIRKIQKPGIDENARRFLTVLDLKNKVEYEEELVSEKTARNLTEHAERFYQWAKSHLIQ